MVLAVFGGRRALARLRGTLRPLAADVSHAAGRVLHGQELSRQRCEAYFQSLCRDATDVIMIAEEDGAIRYATPSAARIFGEAPAPGTPLVELVGMADREVVARSFERLLDHGKDRAAEGWRLRGRRAVAGAAREARRRLRAMLPRRSSRWGHSRRARRAGGS